jgi:hypothetical protein
VPVKKVRGRLRVVSTPQKKSEGRRAPIAVATRPRIQRKPDVGAVGRLVDSMLVLANAAPATPAQRRRPKDIRHAMTKAGQGHLAQAVTHALAADGGALLRTVANAHTDFKDALYVGLRRFVDVLREHEINSAAATGELVRSVIADAFAGSIAARVAATGFGDDTADLLKQMTSVGASSRLDLHSALVLAKSANDVRGNASSQPLDLRKAIAEAEARANAQEAAGAGDEDEGNEANTRGDDR